MNASMGIAAAAAAATALLSACAGYTVKPVADDAEDAQVDGIRYYEVAPYLLVYGDGKGGITSRIEMMPDLSRKRAIDLHAFASKNDTTLTFVNGMLASSKFIVDDTVIPAAIVDTIKTLGVTAVTNAMNDPNTGNVRQIPPPYLFKIVIDRDGTRLVGGPAKNAKGGPVVIKVAVTDQDVAASKAGDEK